jgi:hypothetical protein
MERSNSQMDPTIFFSGKVSHGREELKIAVEKNPFVTSEEPRIKQRCWNNSSRRRLTFQPMKTKGFADRIQTRSETFVSTTPSRLKTQRSELTDDKDVESPVSIGALTKETGRRRSSEN